MGRKKNQPPQHSQKSRMSRGPVPLQDPAKIAEIKDLAQHVEIKMAELNMTKLYHAIMNPDSYFQNGKINKYRLAKNAGFRNTSVLDIKLARLREEFPYMTFTEDEPQGEPQ